MKAPWRRHIGAVNRMTMATQKTKARAKKPRFARRAPPRRGTRWRLAVVGSVFAVTTAIAVVAHLSDPRAARPAVAAAATPATRAAAPAASVRLAAVPPHYKVGTPYIING